MPRVPVVPVLLATGLVLALSGAAASAAPAPPAGGVPGCEDLLVLRSGPGEVRVAVPAALGRLDLPASAFTATDGATDVVVTASRVPAADLAVVVVLTGSASTTAQGWGGARSAALELLVGLPADARTAVVVAGADPQVVTPLGAREPSARALADLEVPPPGDLAQALALGVEQVGGGASGHVVLLSDDASPVVPGAVLVGGTQLHRLHYGPEASAPPTVAGCPATTAGVPLLAAVDAVVRRVQGEYDLRLPPDRGASALLLEHEGVRATAVLSAPTPAAAPPAAGPAARSAPDAPGSPLLLPLALLAGALVVVTGGLVARTAHVQGRDAAPPPPPVAPRSPGPVAVPRQAVAPHADDAAPWVTDTEDTDDSDEPGGGSDEDDDGQDDDGAGLDPRDAADEAVSSAASEARSIRGCLLPLAPLVLAARLLLDGSAPSPGLLVPGLLLVATGSLWLWDATSAPYGAVPVVARRRRAGAGSGTARALEQAALRVQGGDDLRRAVATSIAEQAPGGVDVEDRVRVVLDAVDLCGGPAPQALETLADRAWDDVASAASRLVVAPAPAFLLCLLPGMALLGAS